MSYRELVEQSRKEMVGELSPPPSFGRIIAVGDPNQAIYRFRGANSDSFNLLKDLLKAKVLPLSYCYRCNLEIVKEAQTIVPRIQAPPGTPEGKIASLSKEEMIELVSAGDFIICRVKLPLIEICLSLISEGKKAFIAGEDRSQEMCDFVERLVTKAGGLDPDKIQEAGNKYADKLRGEKKFFQAQNYAEKVEMFVIILQSPLIKSSGGNLLSLIRELFTPSPNSIRCSTIHKVKGLESDRVFLYRPDLIPHSKAKKKEELEQEWNLKYVAITRAKKELYYVEK